MAVDGIHGSGLFHWSLSL